MVLDFGGRSSLRSSSHHPDYPCDLASSISINPAKTGPWAGPFPSTNYSEWKDAEKLRLSCRQRLSEGSFEFLRLLIIFLLLRFPLFFCRFFVSFSVFFCSHLVIFVVVLLFPPCFPYVVVFCLFVRTSAPLPSFYLRRPALLSLCGATFPT